MPCKYCERTDRKWVNNAPCVVCLCHNPERVKCIKPDKAGFHSRYVAGDDSVIEVRSIVCNKKHCSDFVEKDENE